MIGAETHQIAVLAVAAAYQLSDVVFPTRRHLRPGCVTQVRIVRPDDGSRRGAAVAQHGLERFEHVSIPEIPRERRAVVHRAVVLLRARHQLGVALGIEGAFGVDLVAFEALGHHMPQHRHHLALTFAITP